MTKGVNLECLGNQEASAMLSLSTATVRLYMKTERLYHWKIPGVRRNGVPTARRTNIWAILKFCENENYPVHLVENYVTEHFGEGEWKKIVSKFQTERDKY